MKQSESRQPLNHIDNLEQLIQKGTKVPEPKSVYVGEDVDIERISGEGVTLYPGTRICGKSSFIAKGAQISAEGTATILNCYIGPYAELKGGFFNESVFLAKTSCGLGSHVREGTILEEQASIAHTVGLKQTILFPFVTLGSLINFCDCFMSGGTGRQNHSEVGSSYIHFNFTPNQDKATPSLIGDIPRGVMLNQSPIFLGGQGGLVGPSRLEFGTVIAAGTINRKDQLKENHLVLGEKSRSGSVPYSTGTYYNLRRILRNNIIYIGNLYALRQWYIHVRSQFTGDDFAPELFDGLKSTLMLGISERIKQLGRLADKLAETNAHDGIQHDFPKAWQKIESRFEALIDFSGNDDERESFLEQIARLIGHQGKDYLRVIKSLDMNQRQAGTGWLDEIVSKVVQETSQCVTSLAKRP